MAITFPCAIHAKGQVDSIAISSNRTKEEATPILSDSTVKKNNLAQDFVYSDTTQFVNTEDEVEEKASPIDAKVEYEAKDSIVLMGNGIAFLHGSGDVKYRSMELTSEFIRVRMDSSTVFATGVLDSASNEIKGRPVFAEGKDKYESHELTYNLQTKKGYIRHVVTEQGEGYVISENTKKVTDDIMFMKGGKYTTCQNHDHPHFYLSLTKAKIKPGDYIATGPAYMVVGDVPLPLAIPFGVFPFSDQYASGLIMPTIGDDYTRGLYLKGLGYYFAISDYIDLELTGDIYTKGTWAIAAKSVYKKRYKFSGNISVNYRSDITGEKGMPDYTKATNFNLKWTHTQDSKANPYSTFSASVDFATAGYHRSNIDDYYNGAINSQNTKSSSISYTQRFPDAPWTISMSALVNQRTKDSTISLNLPDISISMSRIYPFKRKKALGKEKWYEKISIAYTANIKNGIECKEKYLMKSNFVKDWRNGIKHNVPISASFVAFKYLTITPSVTLTDRMYFSRIDQQWNQETNSVERDTTTGFYNVFDFNTSLQLQTKLYGYYTPSRKLFGPNPKIDKIRHVFTPSVSVSYHPDFGTNTWGYYGEYDRPVIKAAGDTIHEMVRYSRFSNSLYGVPGSGNTGIVSFSLGNNLEMKLRNDKDTTGKEPYKVVSLIDNLSISGGYNFLADSMNWQNFQVNLRIKLPINYTLNLSGAFDPYMYELTASGRPVRTNKAYWNHGKFPHFLGTGTSLSYTFNNATFKKWFGKKDKNSGGEEIEENEHNTRNVQNEQSTNKEDDDGYINTNIQWSLTVNYSVRYSQTSVFDYNKMQYKMGWTHNLSFSGSLSLGEGWSLSATTSYDFKAKQFTYTNFNVTRDLHCWNMSASFVPFGPYKSYTFHIGVKASMLQDLKYDKSNTSNTNGVVNWW